MGYPGAIYYSKNKSSNLQHYIYGAKLINSKQTDAASRVLRLFLLFFYFDGQRYIVFLTIQRLDEDVGCRSVIISSGFTDIMNNTSRCGGNPSLTRCHPATTRKSTNPGLMLGHRLRRWPNIKLVLVQRLGFPRIWTAYIIILP